MCFVMDPILHKKVCYVQFPQKFDGIDLHDRYANRNIVFFDVRMIMPSDSIFYKQNSGIVINRLSQWGE